MAGGPWSIRTNPSYGRGAHTLEPEAPAASLVERLRGALLSPGYRAPVLPSVALELMSLSRRDDVQLRDILELLERDSLIAGGVLHLAQGPLYRRSGHVRTLSEAVSRLGLRTVSDLCWSVAMNARVFRAPGYEKPMDTLRRHSAATAQLARLIGGYVTFPDDYVYTCGLMHDAGAAACLALLGDVPRGATRPVFELAWPAVLEVHEQAAGILTAVWQLPDDVRLIVAHHHQPRIAGKLHPVIAAVVLAEALASELGVQGLEPAQTDSASAAAELGIEPPALSRLRNAAEAIVRELD